MLGHLLAKAALLAAVCISLPVAAFQATTIDVERLPPEARETLRLIDAGGPFPQRRDGITFQNREGRLPEQSRGFYREYTVETPGLSHRGARRIITGDRPPVVFYYTADHYKTFRRIQR
jgi:ribonuclease T1